MLAAKKPLYKASWTFLPTPKTSPVDLISGPKETSTFGSFWVENTGTFTDTNSGSLYTSTPYPKSLNLYPSIVFVARSTIGTPDTLLIYGTVLDALGLTSITYSLPSNSINCMLIIPFIPIANANFLV